LAGIVAGTCQCHDLVGDEHNNTIRRVKQLHAETQQVFALARRELKNFQKMITIRNASQH
jgi:hypothetical protein